jgi:hypothetical protein
MFAQCCSRATIVAFKQPSIYGRELTFSRRNTPKLCMNDPPEEGVALPQAGSGECRVPVAPAAARVVVVSTRVSHHGRTGTPGLPCAMVLTVSFVLSPVIGYQIHTFGSRRVVPYLMRRKSSRPKRITFGPGFP